MLDVCKVIRYLVRVVGREHSGTPLLHPNLYSKREKGMSDALTNPDCTYAEGENMSERPSSRLFGFQLHMEMPLPSFASPSCSWLALRKRSVGCFDGLDSPL